LRRISFAIPEEKILQAPTAKNKEFALHVVDPEVRTSLPDTPEGYAFSSETIYYRDLQSSRFGITTRRAGWYCLRHYEIAANGCVPCFRNLEDKALTCAPHGLRPGINCLAYRSWDGLRQQVSAIGNDAYMALARGALLWARGNSCEARALEVLGTWKDWSQSARSGRSTKGDL